MYDGSGRGGGRNATDQALMRFLGQETFHKLDEVSSYAVTKSQSFNSANKFSQAYIAGAGRTFYKARRRSSWPWPRSTSAWTGTSIPWTWSP